MAKLGDIPLHPALASAASSTTISSSRQARTLSSTSTFSSSSLGGGGRTDAAATSGSGEEQAAGLSSGAAAAITAKREGGEVSGQPDREEGDRGGSGVTLLDCIPVEREQRLLESCRTSQRRFQQEADNVGQKYSTIERVSAGGVFVASAPLLFCIFTACMCARLLVRVSHVLFLAVVVWST